MKYYLLLLIGFTLLLGGCKKEVPKQAPNPLFAQTYPIEGNQVLLGSTKAPDGGYLLWGSTDDNTTKSPNGFLMKLDANQNLVWYKMVGGNRNDEIRSACYDKDGNIMATGMSLSFDDANRIGEFQSMYTVYLNGNGDVIWEKYYTAPSDKPNLSTVANKILYLPDGNFALIGSTLNYKSEILFINKVQNVYRAFILTINNQGDTIGSASYDVLLDDKDYGLCYFNAKGISATLTQDGSILLLVVREINCYFNDGQFGFPTVDGVTMFHAGGSTLFKINPSIHFGYNNYIWKTTVVDVKLYGNSFEQEDTYFCPVQFKTVNAPFEQYMISYYTYTGIGVNYSIFNKDGQLIKNLIETTPLLKNFTTDLESIDGSVFLLSPNSFSKMNQDGQLEWTRNIESLFSSKFVSGIYPQEDKSLLIFCASTNSKLDTDIGCIKFNALGEISTP
jgi:hypothetical protein